MNTNLDLTDGTALGLYDDWLGLDVRLKTSRPTDFLCPLKGNNAVETVSQSVEGFELVHQSVAVQPHWRFVVDESGVWSVEMQIELDTSVAYQREHMAHSLLKDAAMVLMEGL